MKTESKGDSPSVEPYTSMLLEWTDNVSEMNNGQKIFVLGNNANNLLKKRI